MKKTRLFAAGTLCLILGITLVLLWWPQVAGFFKGVIGMALAVAGLVMLTLVKD